MQMALLCPIDILGLHTSTLLDPSPSCVWVLGAVANHAVSGLDAFSVKHSRSNCPLAD